MKDNIYNQIKKQLTVQYLPAGVLLLMGVLVSFTQVYAQNWTEAQQITASDGRGGDLFGGSVSVSGEYAIIGARQVFYLPTDSTYVPRAGAAYIFMEDGSGNWEESQKLVASDLDTLAYFGWSVAIAGNYAIVGAKGEARDASGNDWLEEAGAAYVFELDGNGEWQEVEKLVASDRDSLDRFGWTVAIDGNYAVVGAYTEDHDANGNNTAGGAGSAYVFERDGNGNWTQMQKIVASDRGSGDRFSYSVAISGTYIIVGADMEDEDSRGKRNKTNSGSAYIFELDGSGNWQEVDKIVASDRAETDLFGHSVAIDGDLALIGAYSDGHSSMGNAGSAYFFQRNGQGQWKEEQKIIASDADPSGKFGECVSLDDSYAIVSSSVEHEDESGNNYLNSAGAAYLFEQDANGSWSEANKIVASDREAGDKFGISVSISGEQALVGAFYKDVPVTDSTAYPIAGAAYFFEREDLCTSSTLAADAGSDQYTYFGYSPEECADLVGSGSGGTTPYSYAWDGVTSTATITVCPSTSTTYTLTVTDADGCLATDEVVIDVTNVKCKGKKIEICHSGSTQCVSESQVASHLTHGDYLGACQSALMDQGSGHWRFKVYPNPTDAILRIDFEPNEEVKSITLENLSGKEVVRVDFFDSGTTTLDLQELSGGLYILHVQFLDGSMQTHKVLRY